MKNAAVYQMVFLSLCLGLFSSCSESTQTSGGIWDETQNTLAVRIRLASGEPAVAAKVRLVTETAVVEDSAVADESGIARLKRPSQDGFIEVQEKSGVARNRVLAGDSLLTDTLKKPASLQGKLVVQTAMPRRLFLFGTSYAAEVSESGAFRFENIPDGEYAVLSEGESEYVFWETLVADGNAAAEAELAEPSPDSVLVEDFERSVATNRFAALTGASWWFTSSDSLSHVEPESITDALVRSPESFETSQSAHYTFVVDTTLADAFALCGFDIGVSFWQDSTISYDMSQTDSVSFYIRGSGHVVMQFAGLNEAGEVESWDFEFDIPSSTEWVRVAVPPSGNETWEKIKSRMRMITFLSTRNMDLWLDKIVFHGVSAQDLFRDLLGR